MAETSSTDKFISDQYASMCAIKSVPAVKTVRDTWIRLLKRYSKNDIEKALDNMIQDLPANIFPQPADIIKELRAIIEERRPPQPNELLNKIDEKINNSVDTETTLANIARIRAMLAKTPNEYHTRHGVIHIGVDGNHAKNRIK